MAHLLGGQECVESLRRDVVDLQGALVEVISRTGPVRFPSWKFPDKVGWNVDLVSLLQQYDYVEGELEFNQHSHVVLLELLIDRLLLLLQSFNTYTEQMIGGQRPGRWARAGDPVCIGPVVRRYWSSLVQFSSQQRHARIQSAGSSEGPSSSVPSGAPQTRGVASQTLESALVPCDACAGVQAALRQGAAGLASLSKCLGLPCSLWGLLEAVDETLQLGRLSACDVALWACEQNRDLGRIQDQVSQLKEQLDSLRERAHQLEEERENARAELQRERHRRKREEEERERLREEGERERERRRRRQEEEQRKKEEEWRHRLQEMKIRAEQELRSRQEELKRGAEALELKISELQEELKLQRETQKRVEREREALLQDVHRMEEKRKEEEMELRHTKKLLEKEIAKYQSGQRQHQAMQVKQRALLDRVDALVQQCEELQVRLDECEEKNADLTHTLTHTVQERDALQERLTQQESECVSLSEDRQTECVRIGELEECVSRLREDLNRAAERETILVAFPELSPQNTAPQSTGDVLTDMEQQLKANTVRILVLEQENASLTNSLTRLKHTRSHTHTHTPAVGRPDSGTSTQDTRERAKEAQAVSSTSILHQQTLRLSVSPDTEQAYSRGRRATHTCSAGTNRRRK